MERKWMAALLSVAVFAFILSFRMLSDPDLGFHLKYGEWIYSNGTVPDTDHSTFTVAGHAYIDLHWLFQLLLYLIYALGGYPMISAFVALLGISLFLLQLVRFKKGGIALSIQATLLLWMFIIVEPRIEARPEMISWIFLTLILMLRDTGHGNKYIKWWLAPLVMLVWCNMHALFITGLVVLMVGLVAEIIRNRKIPAVQAISVGASFAVCLVNPYGLKGALFPFELLSRFRQGNIFHEYIREFEPFFARDLFFAGDYLFILFIILVFILVVVRFRFFHWDELMLMGLFFTGALMAVRNIPLFMIVTMPIAARHTSGWLDLQDKTSTNSGSAAIIPAKKMHRIGNNGWALTIILISVTLSWRLFTQAFYCDTHSYHRLGLGADPFRQPMGAATFLKNNRLDNRMLNSLGFGGWLSWETGYPVFIDGRLEVMQEAIYREITESWKDGLEHLTDRYSINIICYNHRRYSPWTRQLAHSPHWRLVYADGQAAVFLRKGYRSDIPEYHCSAGRFPFFENTGEEADGVRWWKGFFVHYNDREQDSRFLHVFLMQYGTTSNRADNEAMNSFNEGNECVRHHDLLHAMENYNQAIALNPGYVKSYLNRGMVRATGLGDMKGALADFTRAIQLDSANGDAWLGRGSVYMTLHQFRQARSDWESASKLGNRQAQQLLSRHFR
jgi:hypothetical protein